MRKLLLLLLMTLIALIWAWSYQSETIQKTEQLSDTVTNSLGYEQSYLYYTGKPADTLGANDSIFIFDIRKKSKDKLIPYAYIELDSIGGTSNQVLITMESKMFPEESYTIRESETWANGQDTIIIIESDSAHYSEYWRLKIAGSDDNFRIKVNKVNWKLIDPIYITANSIPEEPEEPEEPENNYLKTVTIPDYDSGDPTHFLITTSNNGFNQINNSAYNYFFVEPGVYTPDVEITQSGTSSQKKYLTLHRTDDGTHPGQLTQGQNANVEILITSGIEHWVIDRISCYTANIYGDRMVTIEPGCKNIILNRLYINQFWEGINIEGNDAAVGSCTDSIVIQNCRLDRMWDNGFQDDRSAIFLIGDPWDRDQTRITNVWIVNNEIVNCNDGIQALRSNSGSGKLADFQGLVIDNNDIYIDSTIYTDGAGNNILDPDANYSQAENGIDIKAGSDNVNNPITITNNHVWGFRITDNNHLYSGSGSYGEAIVAHYFSKYLIIQNNVVFKSSMSIDFSDANSVADPSYPGTYCSVYQSTVSNNILYDHRRSYQNIILDEGLNVIFEKNVIVHDYVSSNWLREFDTEVNCTFSTNAIIGSTTIAGSGSELTISGNHFYGCTGDNSSYGTEYGTIGAANMDNYTFTTDNFTNSPKTIILNGVVTTSSSPHYNDFND